MYQQQQSASLWRSNHVAVNGFYRNSIHEEALARLNFLVEGQRRLGLLLGPAGCGKSMLLALFAAELRQQPGYLAQINLLGLDSRQWLWSLAAQFEAGPEASESLFELSRIVDDRLTEIRLLGQRAVVLLDDADEASAEVLAQVARLALCDMTGGGSLTLVLSAASDRLGHLGRRLLELAELRIDLEPWQLEDTGNYLRQALGEADATRATFDVEAVVRLHELAGGIPRHVHQLADLSILAAAGEKRPMIDSHTVETVFDELGILESSAVCL